MLRLADAESTRSRPTVALVSWFMEWQRCPDLDELDELSPQLTGSSCELCGGSLFSDDEDLCCACVEKGEMIAEAA